MDWGLERKGCKDLSVLPSPQDECVVGLSMLHDKEFGGLAEADPCDGRGLGLRVHECTDRPHREEGVDGDPLDGVIFDLLDARHVLFIQ